MLDPTLHNTTRMILALRWARTHDMRKLKDL